MQLHIGVPHLVGSLSRRTPLTVVPITAGTIVSASEFVPTIDLHFRGTGNDYIRNDPDGKRMRLAAHVVAEDNDGEMIYIHYYGIIDITTGLSAILGGSSDAKTTEYGHSCE